MLDPKKLLHIFLDCGISFAAGVPDSLLKNFCNVVETVFTENKHIVAANEGSAVALGVGHYLGSGELPLVYMQNSGLGNAVNPLVSLCDDRVYGIPTVMLIGWRGELLEDGSQLRDEPQHAKQGEITPAMLDVMNIPYITLDEKTDLSSGQVERLVTIAKTELRPVAILARKGSFAPTKSRVQNRTKDFPKREQIIEGILNLVPQDSVVVGTTGYTSREIFEYRSRFGEEHSSDFLTVGGMGHANSIAVGVANANPEKTVVCIDGDGACLMHMGGFTESAKIPNLIHVLINNGVHDSVGAQDHSGKNLNFSNLASLFGYSKAFRVENMKQLSSCMTDLSNSAGSGPYFVEVMSTAGARDDLGRPKSSPKQNKRALMTLLATEETEEVEVN